MSSVPLNPKKSSPRMAAEHEERRTPDVMALHAAQMREMSEPEDTLAPTPVWLLFFFFAFIGWGGWYLGQHTGGFRGDVFNDEPSAALPTELKNVPVDPMVLGKRVFQSCTQCHQQDGKGMAGTYPPLAGSEYVNGDPAALTRIVLDGLEGDVTVKGEHFNGTMPHWNQLKDEQVAAVMTYIRASFGNQSAPVDATTVAAIRKETTSRGKAWSAAELRDLPKPAEAATPAR